MNISLKRPKMLAAKKKNKRKRNKNIKKLFEQLRNESDTSVNMSQSIPTIFLDNSLNTSIESSNMERCKRKLSPEPSNSRKKRKSESVIIINDEDLTINENPCLQLKTPSTIQCSTPIRKNDSKTLSELIINSFPKNNNSSIVNLNKEITNLTKQINRESYLTIDLTDGTDAGNSKVLQKCNSNESIASQDTVIDLINNTDLDCSIISVITPAASETSLSRESEVTVLHKPQRSNKKQMHKIVNGIAQLNSSEKGKLLEYITEKIFSGCSMPKNVKNSMTNVKETTTIDNDEKERINKILSNTSSSINSVGSNVYRPERKNTNKSGLRMIVIDGSNVAMEHGKGKVFSVQGLKICIDYFVKRGHRVKAFVPRFRCKFGKSTDPRLLDYLERQGTVVYTPSREIKGKTITPYDDRYIIQCAAEFDGVVVTGDNYRDLIDENSKWRFVIENRLLPFTWVDDMIMFPRDPLGRNGPTLQQFLKHTNN